MNPLRSLQNCGQAVWIDFLSRRFIADGTLKSLVERDGITGVTSNPSILEKAIGHGAEYDAPLRTAMHEGGRSAAASYERLAIEDIRAAADMLRPVYDATRRRDGYVSLEVSPDAAMDAGATVAEARRLWRSVDRENLMVKVPATGPGLRAIGALVAEEINVNATLLFSGDVHAQVAEAYLTGIERLAARGRDLRQVASVASFFVSRIDAAVEKLVDMRLRSTDDPRLRSALERLKGRVAVANAKLAYRRFKHLFSGQRWNVLHAMGARPQRLLWASTGTKNPAYSDVLYVEELVGPETVTTMPPATMDAYRAHGRPRARLEEDMADAEEVMATLARVGISMDRTAEALVAEGVRQFAEATDRLMAAIEAKRGVAPRARPDARPAV